MLESTADRYCPISDHVCSEGFREGYLGSEFFFIWWNIYWYVFSYLTLAFDCGVCTWSILSNIWQCLFRGFSWRRRQDIWIGFFTFGELFICVCFLSFLIKFGISKTSTDLTDWVASTKAKQNFTFAVRHKKEMGTGVGPLTVENRCWGFPRLPFTGVGLGWWFSITFPNILHTPNNWGWSGLVV